MADPPVDIQIRGVRELESGMGRLAGNIDKGAVAAFKSVSDQVATMVRGRVPKRTGRMAGSLSGQSTDRGGSAGYDLIYAGPVDYGGWPPGRPYIAAGRYLYPTAVEAAGALQRAGENAAKQEIRSMSWPIPTVL